MKDLLKEFPKLPTSNPLQWDFVISELWRGTLKWIFVRIGANGNDDYMVKARSAKLYDIVFHLTSPP